MDGKAAARAPGLGDALIPVAVLIVLLAAAVSFYGDGASSGPNQIALLLALGTAALVGSRLGHPWASVQAAMAHGLTLGANAIYILLAVGALIGAWILCGTVPTMIHYGLTFLDPSFFYPASCLLCALVSLSIGSSWTTAGTIGVALMGVASGIGMSPEITAGAVISGSYFGDKMSPLSDTTNLAPAAAGAELFAHIRHMSWTTLPSIALALVLFALLGLSARAGANPAELAALGAAIDQRFALGPHLLLPLALVLWMAWRRMPALPTIAAGALVGIVFAVLFQPELTREAGQAVDSGGVALAAGAWTALYAGFNVSTGSDSLDTLLHRGGMASMLNTIWLTACALAFGAVMERLGFLERLVRGVLGLARSTAALIILVLLTAFGINVIAADQYIAIVLPGRIYRFEFERRGLAPENLSRALEDSGTLTSPLVPWNTCGAYMAATLGVGTLSYLPYAFFNWLSPIVAGVLALIGFRILPAIAAADAAARDRA